MQPTVELTPVVDRATRPAARHWLRNIVITLISLAVLTVATLYVLFPS